MPKACAGGVPGKPESLIDFPDTFQPCPSPAVWICEQTQAPFCGAHRQEIEFYAEPPQGCETPHPFKSVKDNRYCGTCGAGRLHRIHAQAAPPKLPAVRNPRAFAWIASAIGSLSLATSEFAGEEQTQHEAVADAILDQLAELYKAVTK